MKSNFEPTDGAFRPSVLAGTEIFSTAAGSASLCRDERGRLFGTVNGKRRAVSLAGALKLVARFAGNQGFRLNSACLARLLRDAAKELEPGTAVPISHASSRRIQGRPPGMSTNHRTFEDIVRWCASRPLPTAEPPISP